MKEKNYKNMNFTQKESSYYEFYDRGKVDVMDFWEQKKIFFNAGSWQKDDLYVVVTKTAQLKKEEDASALHKKNKKSIEVEFSLAWNTMFTDN